MKPSRAGGQIIVLFALMLVVLVGFLALAVDVAWKYASERQYQAVADAAALAGAQDLQPATRSTPPTDTMRTSARAHALTAITDALTPGHAAGCAPSADVVDCELFGGRYRVSIRTPSPNCDDCDAQRAVQVSIREPAHATYFAKLYGQDTWDLRRTSVAGLSFGAQYTIVTLRPPASGRLPAVKDIVLNGNYTTVVVTSGDVGTNANMQYSGTGAVLRLDPGYRMDYYDPVNPPLWSQATGPAGRKIGNLIQDPLYTVPAVPAPSPGEWDAASCQTLVTTSILSNQRYLDTAKTLGVADATTGLPDWTHVHCLQPGVYSTGYTDLNKDLTVLLPGLYYFAGGLAIQSMLVGGFDPALGGVTLMFPEGIDVFKQRSGAVLLNAGSRFGNPSGTEPPTAPVMTGGTESLKITLIVRKDSQCVVTLPYPDRCDDNHNKALNLAGGTSLYLAGVQYMPTDNSTITGSSDGQGYVGQVWAWTLTYSGGTTINQQGAAALKAGIIRIDTACSPGESSTGCE